MAPAKVISRKRGADGEPIGIAHTNPILDTRVYNVQFEDGHAECYAANIITENVYTQVDPDGNQFLLMNEIIDHRSDSTAIPMHDTFGTDPIKH